MLYYFRVNGLGDESDAARLKIGLQVLAGVEVIEIDVETTMLVVKVEGVIEGVSKAMGDLGFNAILIPA